MLFVEYSPPAPAGQLAIDDALLNLLEEKPGEGYLRFWEPAAPCVILGRTNAASREIRLDRCRSLGIPVLRRSSGGGTVVQGPGCLNFSLIMNMSDDPLLAHAGSTNNFVLGRNAAAISALTGETIEVSGTSDLTIRGRKISGNAQRRRLRALLFHGSILLDFDIALVEDLLPMPSREPGYRGGRSHSDFLRNLDVPPEKVKGALRAAWGAVRAAPELPLSDAERTAREIYMNPDWTYK